MSPEQNIQEIQKFTRIPLTKIPQKAPETTQTLIHKNQKKLLIQEVKSTVYAQTLTLTTQTHIDI